MQYPKMLYKGNQEKYQTVITDDEDHEAELVADGWSHYGELPESISDMRYASGVGVGSRAGSANLSTLIPVEYVDYDALTLEQLHALLDEKGIKYLKRDSKATLIKLLEN